MTVLPAQKTYSCVCMLVHAHMKFSKQYFVLSVTIYFSDFIENNLLPSHYEVMFKEES